MEEEDEEEDLQNGEASSRSKTVSANDGLPRGLVTWREAVRGAQNAAQLAMAFYILETSVAWDKSIMKASCQVRSNISRPNTVAVYWYNEKVLIKIKSNKYWRHFPWNIS